MIRRPPRSTQSRSSAASDVYKRQLHGLADGDAEAAERLRVLGQHGAPGVGLVAGAGYHVGAPELHHAAPIGLLVVAHLDHVDHALEAEHLAGHAERAAPLAGAGLGGEARGAVDLVVVGPVSYTHLRAHETRHDLVCRLLLEKKKNN